MQLKTTYEIAEAIKHTCSDLKLSLSNLVILISPQNIQQTKLSY